MKQKDEKGLLHCIKIIINFSGLWTDGRLIKIGQFYV